MCTVFLTARPSPRVIWFLSLHKHRVTSSHLVAEASKTTGGCFECGTVWRNSRVGSRGSTEPSRRDTARTRLRARSQHVSASDLGSSHATTPKAPQSLGLRASSAPLASVGQKYRWERCPSVRKEQMEHRRHVYYLASGRRPPRHRPVKVLVQRLEDRVRQAKQVASKNRTSPPKRPASARARAHA